MTVPNGYAGFQWSNARVCSFNGAQRICNTNSSAIRFSSNNGKFNLRWTLIYSYINIVNITVIGISNSTIVYNQSDTFNNSTVWATPFNVNNVDTIIFEFLPKSTTIPTINIDDILYSI